VQDTQHMAQTAGVGVAIPTFLSRLEQLLGLQISLLIKQPINIRTLSQKYGLICFTHTRQDNK